MAPRRLPLGTKVMLSIYLLVLVAGALGVILLAAHNPWFRW